MQELNMIEVDVVTGGFIPLIIAAAVLLSGCATTHGPNQSYIKPKKEEEKK